ncbi:MAG: glycosyltransferase family 2 protein [Nitrospira sp.]|nr:glycosyltransferase family 2 protein [bacterium]MBL7049278.1 glycosyltransferase family 2 protein [Nitrospira sp.]
MLDGKRIVAIIPALNEEKTIGLVFDDIDTDLIDEVVVIDNGSSDRTAEIVKERGGTLLSEVKRGYGYPCLRGIEYLMENSPDIVVFLDGNHSDHPEETIKLVEPIVREGYDMVCGSRVMGRVEEGALRLPVRFGNWLATFLMRIFYGFKYTDVGPFRAIRFDRLLSLKMNDNLGWTIEMQVKTIKCGYRVREVPVSYRAGTGKSKLTGNLKGIAIVGYRIIRAIFKSLNFRP